MSAIVNFLKVKEDKDHVRVTTLQNPDLIPLPPARRTWNWWGFTAYWLLNNMSLSAFTSASAILGYGLSVPLTMAVVLIGNFLILVHTILNGQPGGDHHISFTTYSRIMFGTWGCYLAIMIRSALAVVWYSSQAWLGGLMINTTLSCLSHHYMTWENTFPDSVPFTSKELVGFCLFQIIIVPLGLIKKPQNFRVYMGVSSFFGYMALIGICVAAVKDNGGNAGTLMKATSNSVHGSAFSWAFLRSLSAWYGTSCAGIINKPDFVRFSSTRYSQVLGSIIGKMFLASLVPFMGIVTASAMEAKWGVTVWKLNSVLDYWLQEYYTPKVRAGAFFASVALAGGQICFSVVGNLWSFGIDWSGMLPRFIDIRRGVCIAAVLCWVIQPWTMYNTNTNFGTVMSGFSVFVSPMIAILICDYWVIRGRKLKLTDLYTNSPRGIYYGWKGFNVQALVSFFVALSPGLPGLINEANPDVPLNNQGMIHYYYGNTLFGWIIGFFLYWGLCTIWKKPGLGDMDEADYYGTYSNADCEYWGVMRQDQVDREILAKYVALEHIEAENGTETDGVDDSKDPYTVNVSEKSSV